MCVYHINICVFTGVFSKILTELEYSGIGRNKEQSARLLRHMIANAPKLVKPYQEPILKVIYVHAINSCLCCKRNIVLCLQLQHLQYCIYSIMVDSLLVCI